jgi:RNA polymerase sigma-70 factor (ECF subfamily)
VESRQPRVEAQRRSGDGPAALETPEQILMRADVRGDLQAALDAVPEVFREAVWLRDVEEFTYAEIAGMLGIRLER